MEYLNIEKLGACPEFFLHKCSFFDVFSVISQILLNLAGYLVLLPVGSFSYTSVTARYEEHANEKYYTAAEDWLYSVTSVKNNTTPVQMRALNKLQAQWEREIFPDGWICALLQIIKKKYQLFWRMLMERTETVHKLSSRWKITRTLNESIEWAVAARRGGVRLETRLY